MATTEDRPTTDATANWRRHRYGQAPERTDELLSTMSGIEVDPLYTPDTIDVDYQRDLGFPGEYPYTRGVYPSMYANPSASVKASSCAAVEPASRMW